MGARISIEELKSAKYGKLVILEEVAPISRDGRNRRQFKCLCDCGNETIVIIGALRSGHTRSCGCGHKDILRERHGLCTGVLRKFYMSWWDMKERCDNPNDPMFAHYGGRGISYPAEWSQIEGFADDMLSTWEEGLTLERKDVNANYCKENCTWATMSTQLHNRRKQSGKTSQYVGVSRHGTSGKWRAFITHKDIGNKYLGSFETEYEAAVAYNAASLVLFGDSPNKL